MFLRDTTDIGINLFAQTIEEVNEREKIQLESILLWNSTTTNKAETAHKYIS